MDPELLILAAGGLLLSLGLYVTTFVLTVHRSPSSHRLHASYPFLIPAFLGASLIGNFTAASIVGAARVRLKGGDPAIRDGLHIAAANAPALILWSLFQATVGLLIRTVQERLPIGGRIAAALAGISWTVATMLVVPVLLFERLGILDAVKRSALLLKQRWGEGVTGVGSIGGAMVVIAVPLAVIPVAIMPFSPIAALVAVFAVFVVLLVAMGAIGAVFTAALYEYAVTGQAPGAYQKEDFKGLYRSGRRRFFGLFGRRNPAPPGTPTDPDR